MENKVFKNKVFSVGSGSIAEELGINKGDILIQINGKDITDVFDYRFAIQEENLILLFESEGGLIEYEIEKEAGEDLGIEFETGLMSEAKSCSNKCIFCFVEQLPKNMRSPLYFKDDDMRLSFLNGNYVTLTNMGGKELDRIISYHLSPINISVHTTDAALRQKMLNNKNAGKLLYQIEKLVQNNIELNFQIVLCRGVNDGEMLDRAVESLSAFIPKAKSLSVVPAGLTKYREANGLPALVPFDMLSCSKTLSQIHNWQKRLLAEYGTRFVYASDEFYIKSDMAIPGYSEYEGFPQLENGVGMVALMKFEFDEYIKTVKLPKFTRKKTINVVTGTAAYDFISGLSNELSKLAEGIEINVIPIENKFFGEEITVSGLLTGNDILNQLSSIKTVPDRVFIPANALKFGEPVFLDDMGLSYLEGRLKTKITPVGISGKDYINKVISF